MSSSLIIQNDKLIGAVTHVMMNDPTMGYGIYREYAGSSIVIRVGVAHAFLVFLRIKIV